MGKPWHHRFIQKVKNTINFFAKHPLGRGLNSNMQNNKRPVARSNTIPKNKRGRFAKR